MLPKASRVPRTLRVAIPPTTGAEPSEILPAVKLTLPVGVTVPEAALMVAVTVVELVDGMEEGAADKVVVVATPVEFAVTMTVAEPVDEAKLPVGV